MPCYSPLRAGIVDGPKGRRIVFKDEPGVKGLSLPCGCCIGCKLERARQWAVRIMHEAKMHDDNSFITLTYSDENLPKDGSLSVVTCQLFLKRLRARLAPKRVRFFLCGEYGEKYGRPHYHAIIFGEDFSRDRVSLSKSLRFSGSSDFVGYSSEFLSETWGLGLVHVGDVSFESAAYVANYATKKILTNREDEAKRLCGRKSEFLLMSRRPGIGRSWIERYYSDVFPADEVVVRGRRCRPPRYYDSVARLLEPVGFASVKERREEASQFLEASLKSDGSFDLTPCTAPEEHPRRLVVREKVARAKLAQKSRTL